MLPAIILGLAIVVAVALQTSLLPALDIRGVSPALVVLLTNSIGLVRGSKAGVGAGFVAGLLVASVEGSGAPFGGIMTAHMLVGFLAGKLRGGVFAERSVIAVVAAGAAVILAKLVIMAFAPPPALGGWLLEVAIAVPYSAALAVPVHLFVRLVDYRFPQEAAE
ncbi:MAG: rod shape-determining protein MreD [Armatimonadota bacterium]